MRDSWAHVALGDVVEQVKRKVKVEPGCTYPLLGVRWYGAGPFHRETVTSDTSKAANLYQVAEGDFIYNRLFAWKGSFGTIGADLDGHYVSGEFPLFRCDTHRLHPRYLNLVMTRPDVWTQIERESTGSTATSRNRWKEERFLHWEVALPSLVVQRRVVDLVDAVDTVSARAGVEGEASAALWWSVMKELRPEQLADVAAVASVVKAGGTPPRGNSSLYGGGIPWLKSGEVDSSCIRSTEESLSEEGLAASSAWLMPAESVVVAMYGQGETAGSVGFTEIPMAANQAVLGVVSDRSLIQPRFLYHWLRSQKPDLRERRVGTTQPNLNKGIVASHPVPLLPIDEQERLVGVLDAALLLADEASKVASCWSQMRASLLYELLSGEHAIPESYDELVGLVA